MAIPYFNLLKEFIWKKPQTYSFSELKKKGDKGEKMKDNLSKINLLRQAIIDFILL